MAINSVLTTAVSGLNKSVTRATESAAKIVNLTSDPPTAGQATYAPTLSGNNAIDAQLIGSGGTDLAREFTNLIEARAAYSANVQVIRTAEDLAQISDDIFA